MGKPAERGLWIDPYLLFTRYFCSITINDAITALSMASASGPSERDADSAPLTEHLNHAIGLLLNGIFAG